MKQRLILHIGTHKTGSTAIQNVLFYNRLWLRPMGLYYPGPIGGSLFFPNNHSGLRDTALQESHPRTPSIHEKLGRHDALVGRYILRIKEAGTPLSVLSAEGWSSHLNRYAHRLSALRQHFDVKVIAFFRRPDHWIERFYIQRIANIGHRETRTFRAFLTQKHIETYLFRRHRMLRWWSKAFGQDAIQVIPYEPARPGFDLVGAFLNACGCPSLATRPLLFRNGHANPSLTPDQAEQIRLAFAEGRDVTSAEVRAMKAQRSAGTNAAILTKAERAELLERARPDMDQICADFVRDGRTVMFEGEPEILTG